MEGGWWRGGQLREEEKGVKAVNVRGWLRDVEGV